MQRQLKRITIGILATIQKSDISFIVSIIVASLRLKNKIGERQDSLRRLSRACAGMLVASTQTGRIHLLSVLSLIFTLSVYIFFISYQFLIMSGKRSRALSRLEDHNTE